MYGDHYHVHGVLSRAIHLQWYVSRWDDLGIAELMQLAVESDARQHKEDRAVVFALCRMLFQSDSGEPLRSPMLGLPAYLGATSRSDWPWDPIHLYRGVPFNIVRGYTVAGLPEPAAAYLSYCLRNGVWREDRYQELTEQQIIEIGHDFVTNGPWKRPLDQYETDFLEAQVRCPPPKTVPPQSSESS